VIAKGRFSSVWEILPSAFGVGQYFPNFGETIFNSDLNASQYWYITTTCCELVGRVNNKSITSWQLPRLRGSYGVKCVMDFQHCRVKSCTVIQPDGD